MHVAQFTARYCKAHKFPDFLKTNLFLCLLLVLDVDRHSVLIMNIHILVMNIHILMNTHVFAYVAKVAK